MKTFTDEFCAYAQEVTDCPENLIYWSGVMAISTAIGRKIFMRYGDGELVPNLWMILLGPSSAHKSTALKLARGIITRVNPNIMFPEEWTRELLLKALSEKPHCFMLHDEMRSFFALLERDYNVGAMSCLTTLFEEHEYKRQTMQGEVSIRDAYVCIAGASTPEWLTEGIKDKQTAVLSGFLPRFLLVSAPKTQEKVQVWYKPVDPSKKAELARSLGSISCLRGEATYSDEARKMYEDWFTKFHRRIESSPPICVPFLNKIKTIYSHKMSIIAAADLGFKDIDNLVITPEAFNNARMMLEGLERSVLSVVGGLVESKWDKDREKIMDYLRKNNGCSREELADTVRIHGGHLSKHLEGLYADGKVELIKTPGKTSPLTKIKWIGNGSN